jgi:two-component system NtrC family sensor kinase
VPLRILVIDDSAIALEWAKTQLELFGYEVETNASPFGTQALIQNRKPDLVLLDVDMPALCGDDLCKLIKKNPRMAGTAIVLYSSLEETELKRLVKECGADGFIAKTEDPQRLRAAMEAVLASHRAASTASQPRPTAAGRRTRIYLVDDSSLTLAWVSQVLAEERFQVETCQDPLQAEYLIESSKPDAILLDVNMPDKSGDALCKAIRGNPKIRRLPVFLFSVLAPEKLESLAKECGANGFIHKTEDPNELIAQLRALVTRAKKSGS